MDGDSHLELNAIERMVPHFKDPHIGAVSSLIAIHNNRSLLAKCQEIEYFFTQLVTRFCQSLEKTVLICPGAGTMVRTEIAKNIHHSSRTITEDADFTFEIHRNWRVSQEPDAISYTDAMTSRSSFVNQRIRWLYGVFQTIFLHGWSIRKLWVLWAWIGYLTTPVTFAVLVLTPLMVYVFGLGFLAYLAGYTVLMGFFVWVTIAAPLLWHRKASKKLVPLIPVYLFYQQYLNMIQLWCVFAKLFRRGVTVQYGPRRIHTL
jgi:cellulose synthase/poly-beta-1,6-N-acetylglucosamine synthase-like glycosyltransferase